MSVTDRVMQAYVSKHDLNANQAAFVRGELAKIIAEFMAEPRRADDVCEYTGCTGGSQQDAKNTAAYRR